MGFPVDGAAPSADWSCHPPDVSQAAISVRSNEVASLGWCAEARRSAVPRAISLTWTSARHLACYRPTGTVSMASMPSCPADWSESK